MYISGTILQKKSLGESQKQQKTIANDPQFCSPGKFPTWHPWIAVSHRCGAWPPPERVFGKKNCGKIISQGTPGDDWLVGGGIPTPLKNMSVGVTIPSMWKIKNVPDHQPGDDWDESHHVTVILWWLHGISTDIEWIRMDVNGEHVRWYAAQLEGTRVLRWLSWNMFQLVYACS